MALMRCAECKKVTEDPEKLDCACGGKALKPCVRVHFLRPAKEGEKPHRQALNPNKGKPPIPSVIPCKVGVEVSQNVVYTPVTELVSCPQCLAEAEATGIQVEPIE